MTRSEQAAFNAGVEAMRQMAMIAAITIENRDDAREVRQQAAVAALHGLAEGAKAVFLEASAPLNYCFPADLNNETGNSANTRTGS